MPSKRTTKAELILSDTRKRIEAVEVAYKEHIRAAERADETLSLLRSIYDDLQRQLAPKPRAKSSSTSKTTSARQKKEKPTLIQTTDPDNGSISLPVACLQCGGDENAADHFQPSPNFHNYKPSAKSKAA